MAGPCNTARGEIFCALHHTSFSMHNNTSFSIERFLRINTVVCIGNGKDRGPTQVMRPVFYWAQAGHETSVKTIRFHLYSITTADRKSRPTGSRCYAAPLHCRYTSPWRYRFLLLVLLLAPKFRFLSIKQNTISAALHVLP